MPRPFRLPDLGEGLTEAEIIKVLVQEGDVIQEDAPLIEVETDKANVEIPSPMSGRVAKIHVEAGQTVKVGSVLVTFDDAGAPAPRADARASGARAGAPSDGRTAEARALLNVDTPPARSGARQNADPSTERTGAMPIINYPEVAILGVARARQEPAVHNGAIVPRLLLPLSLTFDHRVADGADGARFASSIVRSLEHPDELLLEL